MIQKKCEDIRFERIPFNDADMAGLFSHHDSFIGDSNHERIFFKRDDLGVLEIFLSFSPRKSTVSCNRSDPTKEPMEGNTRETPDLEDLPCLTVTGEPYKELSLES